MIGKYLAPRIRASRHSKILEPFQDGPAAESPAGPDCRIMRNTVLSWFAILFLLLTACEQEKREETPTPLVAASSTSQNLDIAVPQVNPAATSQPRPIDTRISQQNAAADPVQPLDPGWQLRGDERFGLQVGVPGGWVDVTQQLRMSDMIDRFGPQMILLTNNFDTADRMLSGDPFEEGALVFGFTPQAGAADRTPEEALAELLESADTEGLLPITVESAQVGGMSVAFVDLAYDPFGLFTSYPESMHYQVLLIQDPEIITPAVFVIGASADEWINQRDTFIQISEQVRVSETNANVFSHMNAGDLVQGALDGALNNIWTFTAEEGSYATISLAPEEENVDLTLTLIDPAGNVLTTMDDGYAGDLEVMSDVPLLDEGTYLIEASEFFNEPGRYRLSLLVSDEPEIESGGTLKFGQEITAELLPDNRHLWYFDGIAGQSATLILTSLDENFDIIMEMRSPDDRPIVVLDEGFVGDAEVLTGYELPLTGRYSVVVRGFAGHGGMYTLTLDEGGESTTNFFDVGDLVYGDVRQETLRKNEAHAWFFNGISDNEIFIEVTPSEPTMDLDLWLLGPDLQELVMIDEHLLGESEQITFNLPVSGQYLILVREFFGEPGDYEISLNTEGVDPLEITGRIVYSDTVARYLEPIRRDAWTFTGETDDVIDIVLTPITEDRDLILILVDPAGNAVLSIDATVANSIERLVAFRLTSGGEWKIVVKEFFNEGSEYRLNLTRRELDDQRP